MFEFICSIPNWLGWTFVGILAWAVAVMLYLLGSTLVQMWEEHHEEEEIGA